jgi:hypothetical protein
MVRCPASNNLSQPGSSNCRPSVRRRNIIKLLENGAGGRADQGVWRSVSKGPLDGTFVDLWSKEGYGVTGARYTKRRTGSYEWGASEPRDCGTSSCFSHFMVPPKPPDLEE